MVGATEQVREGDARPYLLLHVYWLLWFLMFIMVSDGSAPLRHGTFLCGGYGILGGYVQRGVRETRWFLRLHSRVRPVLVGNDQEASRSRTVYPMGHDTDELAEIYRPAG